MADTCWAKEYREAAKALWESLEGCGDHSCLLKRPKGMATNGGCRCFDSLPADERRAMRRVLRFARDGASALDLLDAKDAEIKRLIRLTEEMEDHIMELEVLLDENDIRSW